MPKYIAVASAAACPCISQLLIAPFGALQETLAKFGINLPGTRCTILFYDPQMVREQDRKPSRLEQRAKRIALSAETPEELQIASR